MVLHHQLFLFQIFIPVIVVVIRPMTLRFGNLVKRLNIFIVVVVRRYAALAATLVGFFIDVLVSSDEGHALVLDVGL